MRRSVVRFLSPAPTNLAFTRFRKLSSYFWVLIWVLKKFGAVLKSSLRAMLVRFAQSDRKTVRLDICLPSSGSYEEMTISHQRMANQKDKAPQRYLGAS